MGCEESQLTRETDDSDGMGLEPVPSAVGKEWKHGAMET